MKLIVNPHKIEIEKSPVNEKEIDITKVEFEFNDIPDNYIKDAYFTLNDNTYKVIIENNECNIPYEVLQNKGQIEIGVVAYLVENEEEIKRYNPSPVYINTLAGSLKDKYENSEPITPSDKEQMEQAIQDMETKVDNLNIEASKSGDTTTITITRKDGTQETTQVLDGEKGDQGIQGPQGVQGEQGIQGEQGPAGPQGKSFTIEKTYSSVAEMNADFDNMNVGDYVMIASSVEIEDNAKLYVKGETQWLFITDFSGATGIQGEQGPQGQQGIQGPQGVQGEAGNGIISVTKTSTSGLVDTYTILYTNGSTSTFTVTNGATQDLTNYVKNTDYASSSVGGVFKTSNSYNVGMNSSGNIYASLNDYETYLTKGNGALIGKGTLENVITGKDLTTKAYVDGLVGDIATALNTINGENI